jgi:hypothetical protein
MSEPTDWLTTRLNEYEDDIRSKERDLERIRAKRDAFREVIDEWKRRSGVEPSKNGSSPAVLDEDSSIRDSVLAALRDANRPLTTREISERGKELGKELNLNSVRWDLKHGVDDNLYEKLPPEKGSRAKRYRYIG